ncbi:MAG: F0F1 ATP synthase subunit epsilon [Methanosarcina sp.]|nr:F0F1 ATP synthase subunit epsilon [Methanosarcina sp.]
MRKLHLEVITPTGVVVSVEVDMVIAPGTEGEFGVLPGHTSFISGIVPGELRYSDENKTEHLAVTSGFAEVNNDRVSVLVDSAETAQGIDVERAKSARERALTRLAKKNDAGDIDLVRAEVALKRANSRIKVFGKNN